ncbi:transcription elongation factor family protein [Striga asiatica]|uniref:Transcription elongation factor family protein n=1 Tax=Striga asiatica TaxID=4170 RepID=A0A5A7PUM2_STRAF|nr:transcription elongation factor family protein [Striga asiatica]
MAADSITGWIKPHLDYYYCPTSDSARPQKPELVPAEDEPLMKLWAHGSPILPAASYWPPPKFGIPARNEPPAKKEPPTPPLPVGGRIGALSAPGFGRGGGTASGGGAGRGTPATRAAAAAGLGRRARRVPPPTGTFLRVPPWVQYLRQALQNVGTSGAAAVGGWAGGCPSPAAAEEEAAALAASVAKLHAALRAREN